jgi:hypothetical protein
MIKAQPISQKDMYGPAESGCWGATAHCAVSGTCQSRTQRVGKLMKDLLITISLCAAFILGYIVKMSESL